MWLQVLDLDALQFDGGSHYVASKTVHLPQETFKRTGKGYEEVRVAALSTLHSSTGSCPCLALVSLWDGCLPFQCSRLVAGFAGTQALQGDCVRIIAICMNTLVNVQLHCIVHHAEHRSPCNTQMQRAAMQQRCRMRTHDQQC